MQQTRIIVALTLTVAHYCTFAQDIALRDAGFEDQAGQAEVERAWELGWYSESTGELAVSNDSVHTGSHSLKCAITESDQFAYWTQYAIPAPEGASALKLSAWCKAEDVAGAFATIGIIFEDADGYWFDHRLWMIVVADEGHWTQWQGNVAVPNGAKTMRVTGWVNPQARGTGTFWFDDIRVERSDSTEWPVTRFQDDVKAPTPTAAESEQGFVLFTRDYTRVLFPDAKPRPNERAAALSLNAAQGEREPVVVAILALRDLVNVSVTCSVLRNGKHTLGIRQDDVRSVRYHPRDGEPRSGPFNETRMDETLLILERRSALAIPEGRTQPFWITVDVPEGAAPGVYEGVVSVHAGTDRVDVPLQVKVLPFTLDPPSGTSYGMYTRMRTDAEWVRETFADMRAQGMTSMGMLGGSGLTFTMVDGAPHIDWTGTSVLEINMNAYRDAGFPESPVWLMGGDIIAFSRAQGAIESEEYADSYRGIVEQIVAHGNEVGWPEIIFQPIDEPFEHPSRLGETIRLLEILKSIPVRTEEDGMNGAWYRFTDHAYSLIDVLTLHDGPVLERGKLQMNRWNEFIERATADGKEIWYYNVDLSTWRPEPMRFMAGYGLYQSGARGLLSWSYMSSVNPSDPGAVFGRPGNIIFRYPAAPGESGGPTVGYEGLREGIDDYRYLTTLKRHVEEARASGNESRTQVADEIWEAVQTRLDRITFTGSTGKAAQGRWTGPLSVQPDGTRVVSGDHKVRNGWAFEDYADMRRVIADGIIRLQAASSGQ